MFPLTYITLLMFSFGYDDSAIALGVQDILMLHGNNEWAAEYLDNNWPIWRTIKVETAP